VLEQSAGTLDVKDVEDVNRLLTVPAGKAPAISTPAPATKKPAARKR